MTNVSVSGYTLKIKNIFVLLNSHSRRGVITFKNKRFHSSVQIFEYSV